MTKRQHNNYPLRECADAAQEIIRDNPKALVFQKWTCAGCGERVTADVANSFTKYGHHTEKVNGEHCGFITDIEKSGCNYKVAFPCETTEDYQRAMNTIEGRKQQ